MTNGSGVPTDFIGSGWAFPLRIDARGGIDLARGEDDVRESILMILSTPIGERRMRPQFGCGVHDLVFATNSPATHGLIAYHVAEALALSDPRITLLELFDWMTALLLYRLNRVPDRNYIKFLELIGVHLEPAKAAVAQLLFRLSAPQPDTVVIPQHTSVATVRTEAREAIS